MGDILYVLLLKWHLLRYNFSYEYNGLSILFYPDFHIKPILLFFLCSELTNKRDNNFNIVFKILKVKTNPYFSGFRDCLNLGKGKACIL